VQNTLMGLYAKYVLPRAIDLAMRNEDATRLRATWIPQAHGEVLEVGIGSGLNLPFYTTGVSHIFGLDPSIELQQMAHKRAATVPGRITFVSQSAEQPIPLANASIDTVVSTWTLCSIPNVSAALQEMKRVLKTTGKFIFIEHGRSRDPGVARWQNRLAPSWRHIAGGCHLNRKIDDLIREAGFQIMEINAFYLPGPRPMTYTYQGIASLG
jgi:ubiquinone/menaquinone biosynthesis C-methylase UbiE